jgi:hypothetical protein
MPAMQNIVCLDEYRKQRNRARAVMQAPDAPRYFCLTCDTDHFKVYASGTVHCAACGSLIRNIQALGSPER